MTLGFGLLSAQLRPGEDKDWRRAYADTLALTERAEALGYDSIWTTEHHFIDDGYMPSLLVVSAAMAARTERITIGTGVLLAPLHDPLRLAEDAATVQLLSNGRLVLGLGLGWAETEFAAFGPGKRVRGKALQETLEILPKAWSGEPFRHNGEIYHLPEIGVRPTPHAPIPIVIGGGAEAAVRRAARLADGFFANASPDRFVRQVHWAKDEMERIGRDPSTFRWIYYSIMYPADSRAAGWDAIGADLWAMVWKYGDMDAARTRSGPIPGPSPIPDRDSEELRTRGTLIGPSDWLVDQLGELRERADVPIEFVARSFFPTLTDDRQHDLMERIATEVMPHV